MRAGLLTLAALGAIWAGAGPAAADETTPNWFTCQAVQKSGRHYTGAFKKGCHKASATHRGRYELLPITQPIAFSAQTAKPPVWRISGYGGEESTPCEWAVMSGYLDPGGTVSGVHLDFEGCEGTESKVNGAHIRRPELGPLSGSLGYLNRPTGEIGLDLASESDPGGPLQPDGELSWEAARFGPQRLGGRPDGFFGSLIAVVSSPSGVSRGFSIALPVGHYLGELPERTVDGMTIPAYEPLTNPAALEGGPEDVILTHVEELVPDASFPLGIEAGLQAETEVPEGKGPEVLVKG